MGGVKVQIHSLNLGTRYRRVAGCFTPQERATGNHCIGGRVGHMKLQEEALSGPRPQRKDIYLLTDSRK